MPAGYSRSTPACTGARGVVDIVGASMFIRALIGGVPEWLKGADCKSAGARLRWFESNPLHHRPLTRCH